MSDNTGQMISLSTDKLVEQCQQLVGSKTNIGIAVVVIIILIVLCLCCSSIISLFFSR